MQFLSRSSKRQGIGTLAVAVGHVGDVLSAQLQLHESHGNLGNLLFHVCSAFHDCSFVIDAGGKPPEAFAEFRSHMGAVLVDSRDILIRLSNGEQPEGDHFFSVGRQVVSAITAPITFRYESALFMRGRQREVERVQPSSENGFSAPQDRHAAVLVVFDRLLTRLAGSSEETLLRSAAAIDLMYRGYEGQGTFWTRVAAMAPMRVASPVDKALGAAWDLPVSELRKGLAT